MKTCPICSTPTNSIVRDTPYFCCPTCEVWFQSPPPPKMYHGPEEPPITEADLAANDALAAWLFKDVLNGQLWLRTLDIGCKVPVLARALYRIGECHAVAIDAEQTADGGTFGDEGSVVTVRADFEGDDIQDKVGARYDLITLVHVFEHFADPVGMLLKLRTLVNDNGRVFLRLPDHRIPGYERDLTPHHYAIHPFYHCLTSILEALAQLRDVFVIEWTANTGPGQRDLILRPIYEAPTIGVAMIVKNEERDLPRAIQSLRGVADCVSICDTGSTDDTMNVAARELRALNLRGMFAVDRYLGASELENGDWKLWDFSEARNYAIANAEVMVPDWLMWLDADDEVVTPSAIRRAVYWPQFDYFGVWIDGGGPRWIQQRLWKARRGVRFHGRCHEYLGLDALPNRGQIDEGLILHHSQPADGQENSNPRNLRILLREWEEKPTPRGAFYIANTYRDGGKPKEAAEWYQKRLDFGVGFRDEYLFTRLYLARCFRAVKDYAAATAVTLESARLAPTWEEFSMELAFIEYEQGRWSEAYEIAADIDTAADVPATELWREHSMYRDQPVRLMSWCEEHQGNIAAALGLALRAAVLIGRPDAEWAARIERLRNATNGRAPAINTGARNLIALHRPGAIGDILMTLNCLPAFIEANPDAEVHYYCADHLSAPDALGRIIVAAGAKLAMGSSSLNAWRKQYARVIDLVGYPLAEGYPERPMAKHLLQYFGAEMGLQFDALPALTLAKPEAPMHAPSGIGYITMQTHAGWSRYKEWPTERWAKLCELLEDEIGAPIVHIKESNGWTLYESIAMFANARMHLGIDSFTNHLTNYYWQGDNGARKVRGVILWGSTQYNASGYNTNANLSRGLYCQPCFRETAEWSQMKRPPCVNTNADGLHRCMDDIKVADVADAALRLWGEQ